MSKIITVKFDRKDLEILGQIKSYFESQGVEVTVSEILRGAVRVYANWLGLVGHGGEDTGKGLRAMHGTDND